MPRIRRPHLWYAMAAGAIGLLARAAMGQGQGVELAYHAPANCPSAQAFGARVAQTLGSSLAAFGRFGQFQVTIEAVPGGYRLTVTSNLLGEGASRTLDGPDCASVADAGALAIAMALSDAMQHGELGDSSPEPSMSASAPEPLASASAAEPAPSVVPPPASAPRPEPRAPEPHPAELRVLAPRAASEPTEHTSAALALHSVGDYGTLPHVAAGVRVGFSVSGPRWSGRLGLEALLPVTQWDDGAAGRVGGRFWLAAGRVEGCRRLTGSEATRLDGCAVFAAGALRASGVGLDNPKSRGLPWLATGGHLVGVVSLGTQLEGVLGVEALVPLLTTDFTVEDGTTRLYNPSSVVGQVDLGVGWRFE